MVCHRRARQCAADDNQKSAQAVSFDFARSVDGQTFLVDLNIELISVNELPVGLIDEP